MFVLRLARLLAPKDLLQGREFHLSSMPQGVALGWYVSPLWSDEGNQAQALEADLKSLITQNVPDFNRLQGFLLSPYRLDVALGKVKRPLTKHIRFVTRLPQLKRIYGKPLCKLFDFVFSKLYK